MWISGMILMLPALALVMLDWMRVDEREARRMDARPPAPVRTDVGRAEAVSVPTPEEHAGAEPTIHA